MTGPTSTRAGVLCAGSVIVDLGKTIDRYPEREHLALIDRITTSTGGPGLNMAVDLRMLGAPWPIAVAGAVGADPHGAFVRAECAGRDIGTTGLQTVPDASTAFTDAMVERDGGRRTFFHHAGANDRFDGGAVDVEGSTARILHVGAPGIHDRMDADVLGRGNGWSALLERARAAGLRTNLELVSIDPGRLAELVRPCLPLLDTVVVNEWEACAVTGVDVPAPGPGGATAWDALEAVALDLVGRGVSTLAVVHFPAGSVAAAPDGRTWRQGALRVPPDEVRSTTGAGDAYAAGVMLGLHDDWPVERCLQLGAAAAGMCVRSWHTSDGVPAVDAALASAARYGYGPTGGGPD